MFTLSTPLKQQSGVVLVISLVMLLLLTLIGVTSVQTTSLEEKMAGNMRDQNIAFQAAEAALRDAEADINSTRISGVTTFDALCTNGLCYNGGADIPSIWTDATKVANAVSYGAYTGVAAIAGLAAQPKYLIVGTRIWPAGATSWKYLYSITALAQGARGTTKIILHEVYTP